MACGAISNPLCSRRRGQKDYFPKTVDKPVPPVAVAPQPVAPPAAAATAAVPTGIVLKLNNAPARGSAPLLKSGGGDRRQQSKPRGRPDSSGAALSEQGKDLTKKLESGRYECVICIASIGKKAQVWACSHCYVVLHLACVKTWASKSSDESQGAWRCPHCQHVIMEEPKHVCYCGKTVRPDHDPYLVVNSCGEVCERHREGTDCPHTCNLVCHPGPCPPCLLQGPQRSCHCGKRVYRLKCSEVEPQGSSCGEVCGKPLSCEMHACERVCHSGPCGSCTHTEQQLCFCGKEKSDRPCGSGQRNVASSSSAAMYACGNKCGKPLACGNHACEQPCHPGACQPCATAVESISRCPCGWRLLSELGAARTSCLDPVATCTSVCGRQLACGHECKSLCHAGKCDCPQTQKVSCRCGSSKKDVPCSQLLAGIAVPLCHQTCSTLRSCGKHQCNTKCCPSFKDASDEAGMHVCRLVCGKKLRCGNHVCEESCHKGRCGPCHQASFEEWICPCGKTVVYPPISCGQKMPSCNFPCAAPPRACGHVDTLTHPCHPVTEPCPPCVALVEVACACGAELRSNVRCHLTKSVSCGRPCNAPLECGQHKCAQPCHHHQLNAKFLHGCSQLCGKTLDCEHSCSRPCHPDEPVCPSVVCERKVEVRCECGRQTLNVPCGLKHRDKEQQQQALAKRPVLACDETCAREQRKKQLALAFGKQHQAWQDSQMLLGLARTHPVLLRRIEQNLAALISRNSGFPFDDAGAIVPNVVFPAMTSAQRKLVHLLAESFGLRSESFGEDAQRSVWVTLKPNAKIPSAQLSQVIAEQQKEAEAKGYRAADCGVLLSQLSSAVKTPHIQTMLQQHWKSAWVLHWIDEHSCLVIFDEPQMARVAANTLKGPFVATIFHEEQVYKLPAAQGPTEAVTLAATTAMDELFPAKADGGNNNNDAPEEEAVRTVAFEQDMK